MEAQSTKSSGRQKAIYLHRITDGAYFIYKMSNYTRIPVNLIHVGMAYNKKGLYSTRFKKLIIKYALEKYEFGSHTTAETYSEFLSDIYVSHEHSPKKIPIPKNSLALGKIHFKQRMKKITNDLNTKP